MKKVLSILLVLVMCVSLFAACANSNATTGNKETTGNTAPGDTPTTKPDATEPKATEPKVTEPEATEPKVTEPEATEPKVTEPDPTEPDPTEPDPTEPDPTEPDPTEPDPTEPDPTEPDPTEPDPAEGLSRAKEYLFSMYRSMRDTAAISKFSLVSKVIIGDNEYTVTWTVDNEEVTIEADAEQAIVWVNFNTTPSERIDFTLTATIDDGNGNIETIAISRYVEAVEQIVIPTDPIYLYNDDNAKFATGTVYPYTSSSGTTKDELVLTANTAEALKLTVRKNADGTVTFVTEDGKFLFCDGSNVNLANAEGEYTLFVLEPAAGGMFIRCNTAQYNGNAQYLEVYSGYLTCYTFNTEKTYLYTFKMVDSNCEHKNVEDVAAVEATCTTDGCTAGKVCKDCGVTLEGCETITAPGHTWSDWEVTTEATEETAGEMTRTCSVCGETETKSYELSKTELVIVEEPEVGVAYKFGLYHGGLNATVYFNGLNYESKGTTYAWYLAFTEDKAEAVDVYLEAVEGAEGHYRMYFLREGEKVYIRTYPRDGDTTKGTMELTTTVPEETYTYDAEYKTLIYTSTTGEKFYLGSSGTYKSISVSSDSYISSETSYPAHFYAESAGGETGDEDIKAILDKAFALQEDESMTGNFTLTGVIVEVKTSYSGVQFVIEVDGDGRQVLCYKVTGDNAKDLQVGDTVTVSSEEFKNYKGTIELNRCTLVSFEYGKDHVFVERVVKPALTEEGNTLIFNVGGWGTENGWTKGTQYKTLTIKEGLTVIINCTAVGSYGENSGKYYPSDDGKDTWRLYQSENATFTLTSDKKIATIKVTYSVNKDADRLLFNGVMYESGAVIEVNDTTFTFGVSNIGGEGLETYASAHVRIEEIEIVYADEGGTTPSVSFTEAQQGTYNWTSEAWEMYYTLKVNADGTVDYLVSSWGETYGAEGIAVTDNGDGTYSFTYTYVASEYSEEVTATLVFSHGFACVDDMALIRTAPADFTEAQQGEYGGVIGNEWDGVFETVYHVTLTVNADGTVGFAMSCPLYDESWTNIIGWDDPIFTLTGLGVCEYEGTYYFYVDAEGATLAMFSFNEDGTVAFGYYVDCYDWDTESIMDEWVGFYTGTLTEGEGGEGGGEGGGEEEESVNYTANLGDFFLTWDGTYVDYVNETEWIYQYGMMPTEENGVYTFSYNRGFTTVEFYFDEDGNIVLTDSDLGTYILYKNGVGDDHIQDGTEGGGEGGGEEEQGEPATFTEEQQGTYEGTFMIIGGFTVKINSDNTVTFVNANSGYDVTGTATVADGVYKLVLDASFGEYVEFTIDGDTLTVTDFYYWFDHYTGTATKQAGAEAATFTEEQQGSYAYEDWGFELIVNADGTVDYTAYEATETGLAVTVADGVYSFTFGGETLSFTFERGFAHMIEEDIFLLKASVNAFTEEQQGEYSGAIGYDNGESFEAQFGGTLTVNANGTVDFALSQPLYDENWENIIGWDDPKFTWTGLGVSEYEGKYYFLITADYSPTYVEFFFNEDGTITMNYMIDPWWEWEIFYFAELSKTVVEPAQVIEDGDYEITVGGTYVGAIDQSKSYGYLPASGSAVKWTITNVEGGVTIQDCYGRYLYMTGTYNSFNLSADLPTEGHIFSVTKNEDGTYIFVNVLMNKTLAFSATYNSCGAYADVSDYSYNFMLATYVEPEGGDETEAGVTISFGTLDNRTSCTTEKQVWESNGITVTNEKASSTSNVNEKYYDPVRFYKGSSVTIDYTGMTKIVITCNTADYATALMNSIEGVNASCDGNVVTIEFAAAVDTFIIESLSAQVRVDSITVYA